MAKDDLDTLREQIPEVFHDHVAPVEWQESWHVVPIKDPESPSKQDNNICVDDLSPLFDIEAIAVGENPLVSNSSTDPFGGAIELPDFGPTGIFPGSPVTIRTPGACPPPEAMAFYLPFHYFHPKWWGVYLVLESSLQLADYIVAHSGGQLSRVEGLEAARIFLYSHEAFHHRIESFSTRLEITHRTPTYKDGFETLYRRVYMTDACAEEAMASAHGIRRTPKLAFPKNNQKAKAVRSALLEYSHSCPPGYRIADRYLSDSRFNDACHQFAEDNYRESIAGNSPKNPHIWAAFPHAFTGISRVNSRTNYIVKKGSPLAHRLNLHLRYP